MAGYPYYPYSVILNVENNKYASGSLPNLPIYQESTRKEAIKKLINQSIKTLQGLAASQEQLFNQVQKENPELIKKILLGRSIAIDDDGQKKTLIHFLDKIQAIDEKTFIQMDEYKKEMNNFMKAMNKKIGSKSLTQERLNELLEEIQSENSIFRGIAEQTKIALKQAPIEIIKLFKQIPKEKLNTENKQGISILNAFQTMINGSVKTLEEVKKILEDDIIIREEFFTKLANYLVETREENDYYTIDLLDPKAIKIALLQKYITNPDQLFEKNISLEIKVPSTTRQQKSHKKKKKGSDLIELIASFGGTSFFTEEEIQRYSIQAFHTGSSTLRKTGTLTFTDTKNKVDKNTVKNTFQAFIKDLEENTTTAKLKYKTSFRDDKPDDIISFITDSGSQYNFQFSDKLIQKDSNEQGLGGLSNISLEGGTLYSTIQLLNNYYPQLNEEHLIFTLLNLSNVSALQSSLDTQAINNFIKMILVSYIYLYAFNPQAEQIHNEIARTAQFQGNTIYFHHIDTGIIPSYILLQSTIKQLQQMIINMDTLQETNQFIKVLVEPSKSFGNRENQLLDFAYKQNNPWKTVADIIAQDTIIDIALDLFALGY